MNFHPNKKLYAAQFRDMHTAVHHLAIYRESKDAKKCVSHIRRHETLPRGEFEQKSLVEIVDINFRTPPTQHKDQKLCIVNAKVKASGAQIPDAY